jgi:hypothetical protein
VYVDIQEGKMAIGLSLHGEFDVGMDVVEVVEEVLQLFGSMGPQHYAVSQPRRPQLETSLL